MFENLRLRLAGNHALPLLALLGIVCGLVVGAVIVLFRLLIESVQSAFLPGGQVENYESLNVAARFLIPFFGAVVIGVIWQWGYKGSKQVGVVHVLERLAYHQGNLPFSNFIAQVLGASISIISGHSVGREGPGIHLGAASSSLLGQWLHLPNNAIRVLVSCGVAASIAASFNTPIAGVIFALEVILMEYSIAGFTPVILSAVSATLLMQTVMGSEAVFKVPSLPVPTLAEMPYLVILGVAVGALAAAFNFILRHTTLKTVSYSFMTRMLAAGLITGLFAVFVPQIMGIGYDTVNQSILNEIALGLLIVIVLVKLVVTAVSVGLGIPAGLIGPTLVIGATAGAAIGHITQHLLGDELTYVGAYALLGMAGMMAATLQAPLAALMALLELTLNTHVLLPGMLVVIIAGLTSSHLFKQEGVFIMLLKVKGLDYRHSPVAQSLRKIGVAGVMSRSYVRVNHEIRRGELQSQMLSEPEWLIIEKENQPIAIMPSVDVAQFLSMDQCDHVDLMEIPGQRTDSVAVGIRDTLQRALELMDEQKINVLFIGQTTKQAGENAPVQGIITRQMIETHYRYR